jgi:hypothetical protein
MEGSMKTLSDVAAGYDDQAKANETMAEEILDAWILLLSIFDRVGVTMMRL